MTVAEIMDQVWTTLGEPTNLDPDTDVSYGGSPMLLYAVNEAARQIATWKDPSTGKPMHIRDLYSSTNFQVVPLTDTIATVNNTATAPYVTLTTNPTSNNLIDGWVLEMTSGDADGEMKLITSSAGPAGICYIHAAFDTAPTAADTVSIYPNYIPLDANFPGTSLDPTSGTHGYDIGLIYEPLSVVDLEALTELTYIGNKEKFVATLLSPGTPTEWTKYGNKIVFNYPLSAARYYKIEYYRYPAAATLTTQSPDIPEAFHWAICLWCMWWGYKRTMEAALAYSTKQDFVEEMRTLLTQYDISSDRFNQGGSVIYD